MHGPVPGCCRSISWPSIETFTDPTTVPIAALASPLAGVIATALVSVLSEKRGRIEEVAASGGRRLIRHLRRCDDPMSEIPAAVHYLLAGWTRRP